MKGKSNGKKSKLILVLAVCILVVAVVVSTIIIINSGKKDSISSVVTVYDEKANITAIYKDEEIIGTVDGMAITQRNLSDSAYYITDENSTLYYIKGGKIKQIGENLSLITIANNDQTALVQNEAGVLYRYNGSKLEAITEKIIEYAAISGDGKSFAYSYAGDSYVGKKPGKETKVEDVMVTYISDDGKYYYGITANIDEDMDLYTNFYLDEAFYGLESFELYLINKNGEKKIINDEVQSIQGLNSDGTEIMYTTEDGSFITVSGKDTYKLTDKNIGYMGNGNERYGYGHYKVIESFVDSLWVLRDDEGYTACCYISEEYEAQVIAEDCERILDIDKDYSKVLYVSMDAELRLAEIQKNSKPRTIAEAVVEGKLSQDGEHIYYVNIDENMEFHYVDKSFKDSKIMKLGTYGGIYIAGDGCYVVGDEPMYAVGSDIVPLGDEKYGCQLLFDDVNEKAYKLVETKIYVLDGAEGNALKGTYDKLLFGEVIK